MKLLILGGTVFLGRHIVEQALAVGHEVTLFNRGRSDPELFEGQGNMSRVSAAKAIASGLEFMPLEEVVSTTLEWFDLMPSQDLPAGLASEKEAMLLAQALS